MQVIKPQNYNMTQNRAYTANFKQIAPSTSAYQPQFTGFATVAKEVAGSAAPKAQGWYDKLTEWIAKNYYARFYNSKAAKYIVEQYDNSHVSTRFYFNFRYVRNENTSKRQT